MLPTRRSIGIFFSKSKSVCADSSGYPVISRYMDADVRQEKGKLCFIKRKGKLFVWNIHSFCEKKFGLMVKCTPERGHNALFFIPLEVIIML